MPWRPLDRDAARAGRVTYHAEELWQVDAREAGNRLYPTPAGSCLEEARKAIQARRHHDQVTALLCEGRAATCAYWCERVELLDLLAAEAGQTSPCRHRHGLLEACTHARRRAVRFMEALA
jgi:hypothetical protein